MSRRLITLLHETRGNPEFGDRRQRRLDGPHQSVRHVSSRTPTFDAVGTSSAASTRTPQLDPAIVYRPRVCLCRWTDWWCASASCRYSMWEKGSINAKLTVVNIPTTSMPMNARPSGTISIRLVERQQNTIADGESRQKSRWQRRSPSGRAVPWPRYSELSGIFLDPCGNPRNLIYNKAF